ncbi:MAG: YraN family protein [Nitrososphaerales archaeon]
MAAQVGRSTLKKLIAAIDEGELNLDEFRKAAALTEPLFKEGSALLSSNQIGIWSDYTVTFRRGDKMKAALLLCKIGEPLNEVAKMLKWSEFEDFAATLLEGEGYSVRRRVRLKKPKCEIDIVAAKDDLALIIDCKHWRRSGGTSTISKVVDAQINRAKALAANKPSFMSGCDKFLTVILTLYSESFTMLKGVPIVPINLLSDFILKIRGYLNEVNIIKN